MKINYVRPRAKNSIQVDIYTRERGSQQRCSIKKGVLKNFTKFTGKRLCQSIFFNKVIKKFLKFIKKETLAQVFSCEFCEIFKNTFLQNTSGPLLLARYSGNLWSFILVCGWMQKSLKTKFLLEHKKKNQKPALPVIELEMVLMQANTSLRSSEIKVAF